jgi:hypothetical protein
LLQAEDWAVRQELGGYEYTLPDPILDGVASAWESVEG